MGKLLVDVDREALERVRVKLGARSHAEALRRLIGLHDGSGAIAIPSAGTGLQIGDVVTVRGEPIRRVISQTVPTFERKPFNPQPKTGKKR